MSGNFSDFSNLLPQSFKTVQVCQHLHAALPNAPTTTFNLTYRLFNFFFPLWTSEAVYNVSAPELVVIFEKPKVNVTYFLYFLCLNYIAIFQITLAFSLRLFHLLPTVHLVNFIKTRWKDVWTYWHSTKKISKVRSILQQFSKLQFQFPNWNIKL